ncbi:hypothetical protein M9H77_32466 [Catharanthus roseus]|uniref:Uncharacterized protein n=1 Tax=Catharanthus roseus TaxID=4058 RepID=A0ACC0A3V5_CATRO|nr:hypothetical protein M9H77_32466 [Catharanthus roseus]
MFPLDKLAQIYVDEIVRLHGMPVDIDLSTRSTSRSKFVENQVNGRVSGLHCTWLVPRTRASSDDVDGFMTLRVDPLEEGRSTLRAWPNRFRPGFFGSNLSRRVYCREARRCPT